MSHEHPAPEKMTDPDAHAYQRVVLPPRSTNPRLEVMNFLNEVVLRHPDAISFAPGRPIEETFDVGGALARIGSYVASRAERSGRSATEELDSLGQYGRTNGLIGQAIARHLALDENIRV